MPCNVNATAIHEGGAMTTGRRLAALLAAALVSGTAHGQAYPDRPIRAVVPFPPGNASDLATRTVAEPLSKRLGQPVVVDNRPGAAGTIGADAVAKAKPDGYTLLGTSSAFSVTPSVYKKLPYDAERDLLPVAPIGWTVMMLVASPSFPANNVQELVAVLKADPGKYSYAHLGAGALSQMVMELLKQMAGVDVVGVPYKGSGQALTDLMGGQLPLMFDGLTSAGPQVKAGRIKALAVSSKQRTRLAPDVPALAESGVATLKDYDVQAWTGVFVPAGTPKAIVDRLNAELTQIVQNPEVKEKLAAQNLEAFPPMTQAEFAAYMKSEFDRWRKVAREGKIEASQ
jgi:tripartite-type tricarboxylate transporter receptor subunit TctC